MELEAAAAGVGRHAGATEVVGDQVLSPRHRRSLRGELRRELALGV
jgi:hypothetical protein